MRIGAGPAGVNVRHRGEDVRAGSVVLTAGTVLRPQELGVAASLGLPQLLVHQRPRVAILSTGDEVAEPGDARKPGQIFDSNRFSLHGLVDAAGGQTTDHGIVPDLYEVLHARLRTAAATADVVITSGGVSVGDHDLVKAVLQDAGGDRLLAGRDAARPPARGGPDRGGPLLRPARQSGGLDAHVSPLRAPRAVEARGAQRSSSRPGSTRWRWSR